MPFISREEFEALHTENDELLREVQTYHGMDSLYALAAALREEIIVAMETDPQMSTSQLGDIAFKSVFKKDAARARDELAAQFEQNHRKELYAQVVDEIKRDEGPKLLAETWEKVSTDPKLAKELRDSARRELAARYIGIIEERVTEEQEEVIAHETERQVQLDKFDVEFTLDDRLELARDDILETLHDGDKLKLYFATPHSRSGEPGCITLEWKKDALGSIGWLFKTTSAPLYPPNGDQYRPNLEKFITPVNLNRNLTTGETIPEMNIISTGFQFALAQRNAKNAPQTYPLYLSYGKVHPVKLTGIDLQTKDLYFFNGAHHPET